MKLRIRTRIALWALAAFSGLLALEALLYVHRSKQTLYALVDETVREDFNEIGHYLGTPGLEEFLRFEMVTDPENNEVFFEIRDPERTGLVLSDNLGGKRLPRTSEGALEKGIRFRDEPHPRYADRGWKVRVGEAEVDGYGVQVAVTLHPVQRAFSRLQLEAGLLTVLLVLLATAGAAWVAARAFEPLKRIVGSARQLSLSSDGKLPIRGTGDEIDELAEVLNGLMGRVRTQVLRMRQFTADAAHELRTPLTAIRGHLELLHPRLDPEGQEVVGGVLEEVDRLASLVKQLLVLERLESEGSELERKPVDLASSAREVVDHLRVVAAERQIALQCETEPVWVDGDGAQVRQLFFNLIDNALKFAEPGGNVGVRVREADGQAEAVVWDDGPGFAPDEADRIFERFYSNRASHEAGIGLGLPIARAIAERHGGTLSLRRSAMTEFILRLPGSSRD